MLQAEKLSSLGELSAGIVHEVRNPLASIKGAIEILGDELAPNSPRAEFAELAILEIERLDRMVGEFLRFARPAKPSIELSDINSIVESVAALIENQATSKGVFIEKDLDYDIPKLSIDAEQIRQALLNLAINALHAAKGNSRISFRTTIKGELCFVTVEDSGEGISEENLAKVFDPFFTTKDKGIGLGLSIAHRIINVHRGRLSVRRTNTLTIFEIRLPLYSAVAPSLG